jgi:50S ribosomal protein L16 3-hydroxylase
MDDPDALGDWFGRFVTVYRSAGVVDPEREPRSRIEVEWDLQAGATLHRHPWTRVAWRRAKRGARLYVDGHDHALPVRDAARIASAAVVDGATYAGLSAAGRDCVFALFEQGRYALASDDEPAP